MATKEEVLRGYKESLKNGVSILGFFEDHRFLSNFHMCECEWNGLTYPSTEHAYQAAKSPKDYIRNEFSQMESASEVRRAGQKIALRKDWDIVKKEVMWDVCWDKFNRHPELREQLLATGKMYLEETNWWKDRYWGVCGGYGANHLGTILMEIRRS